MKAMKEEISKIEKNETWELVPRPLNKMLLGLNGFSKISWMKQET